MQFRPVGIERPGEEVAPEGAEFGEGFCGRTSAGGRDEEEADVIVAMTRPLFFIRAFSARNAVFRR